LLVVLLAHMVEAVLVDIGLLLDLLFLHLHIALQLVEAVQKLMSMQPLEEMETILYFLRLPLREAVEEAVITVQQQQPEDQAVAVAHPLPLVVQLLPLDKVTLAVRGVRMVLHTQRAGAGAARVPLVLRFLVMPGETLEMGQQVA
jgi:hypothetical protein